MFWPAPSIMRARQWPDGAPGDAMTPRGRPLTQARVRELAAGPGVIVLAGVLKGLTKEFSPGATSRKFQSAILSFLAANRPL
jgi:tRNA (guanine37-N1)-methyltransferase